MSSSQKDTPKAPPKPYRPLTFLPPSDSSIPSPPGLQHSPVSPLIPPPFVSAFGEFYAHSSDPPESSTTAEGEGEEGPGVTLVAGWRQLPRPAYLSDDDDDGDDSAHDLAASLYNLLPSPSPSDEQIWESYLTERHAAEEAFTYVLQRPPYPYTDRHDVLLSTIRDTVEVICSTTSLSDPEWKAVADGVTPVICRGSEYASPSDDDEEYYDADTYAALLADPPTFLCSASLLTRLYSPLFPSSVDVRLRYTFNPYPPGKEWRYALGVRVNGGGRRMDAVMPLPEGEDMPDSSEDDGGQFDRICSGSWISPSPSSDLPPDLLEIQKSFSLPPALLGQIRTALFGPPGASQLRESFDPLSTVLLLFASVGIALIVSDDPLSVSTSDDAFRTSPSSGNDDDDDDEEAGAYGPRLSWELGGQAWLAREIRRACGVSLPRDAEGKFEDPDVGYVSDSLEGVGVIPRGEVEAHAEKMRALARG